MTCPCKPINPKNLREVVKCVEPTLFHRVDRPAALGDETAAAPETLDYKNVLLVYQANGHAYLYSSDGIPTFISYLPTAVDDLEEAIKELQQDLANEALERHEADTNLTNSINSIDESLATEIETRAEADAQLKTELEDVEATQSDLAKSINALESTSVQKDTSVAGDASTVTLTKSVGPLDGEATETAIPLPVASSEQAGVMNIATFNAVQDNAENIDSILGGAVVIDDLPASPTQDELTVQWKAATGKTTLINRASIYDTENKLVWYYYENANEWKSMPAGDAAVSVSIATNDAPGIVKGSTEDGQVAVEADGSMSLNGYDGMQHDIENLSQLVAGIEVPKVPQVIVGGTSSQNTGANLVKAEQRAIAGYKALWLSYQTFDQNGLTGTRSNDVPVATQEYDGAMSAADKAKLDSLLEIKSLNDSLELDENGQLSVVGGGSSVDLLSAYTASPADGQAYNAGFMNTTLFSPKVLLGNNIKDNSSSSATQVAIGDSITIDAVNSSVGPGGDNVLIGNGIKNLSGSGYSIIIGRNAGVTYRNNFVISIGDSAKATGSGIALGREAQAGILNSSEVISGSIAIGQKAKATNNSSAALGAYTITSRANEVSIGNPNPTSSAVPHTRYLANVTAGELPTDAVNLQQMQGYVAEHGGGGSASQSLQNVLTGSSVGGDKTPHLSWFPTAQGDALLLYGAYYTDENDWSARSLTIPVATTSDGGLMSPADKNKVNNLGLGSLTNMYGVLQSETDVQIEFARKNLSTGAAETQTAVIETATSEEAGVMSATDKTKLDTVPELTEMQWTRTGNLPPAVVTGFEDTTYGTDTITMHLDTKDLATGGVAVQELELEGAVGNTETAGGHAGLMTAFQATQLAALAESGASGEILYEGTALTTNIELSKAANTFETVKIYGYVDASNYITSGTSSNNRIPFVYEWSAASIVGTSGDYYLSISVSASNNDSVAVARFLEYTQQLRFTNNYTKLGYGACRLLDMNNTNSYSLDVLSPSTFFITKIVGLGRVNS